jgi:hypothetical protein
VGNLSHGDICRRFPKARVWPMVPSGTGSGFGNTKDQEDELAVAQLPEVAVQEQLLELYFAFVHPCFPVVHKRAFFDSIKNRQVANSFLHQQPKTNFTCYKYLASTPLAHPMKFLHPALLQVHLSTNAGNAPPPSSSSQCTPSPPATPPLPPAPPFHRPPTPLLV